jgi:putative DNA primase/helicase
MLAIAKGSSRKTEKWKATQVTWDELLSTLSTTVRTKETTEDYHSMSKDARDEIKDVGGFVGGVLKDGKRSKGSVAWRHLVTLDLDRAPQKFWDTFSLIFNDACCVYSTHSHTPEKPRLRVVIPLKTPVPAGQYEPIARQLADIVGLDYIDATTYQPSRLMYWPSTPEDGEFLFKSQKGGMVDPNDVLSWYTKDGLNWKDPYHWPRHDSENDDIHKAAKKAGDPLSQPGVIGAFNRTYTIPEAIEAFDLPYNKYQDGRYTYEDGSTAGGLVLYNDEIFAYSHHESDPCGRQINNAFDLVRVHLYGDLDGDKHRKITDMPSYKKMVDSALNIDEVSKEVTRHKLEEAKVEFDSYSDEEQKNWDWLSDLNKNKNGNLLQTMHNALMILQNDPKIKGSLGTNEFSGKIGVCGDLPWRKLKREDYNNRWSDTDRAYLLAHMEGYGLKTAAKIDEAARIIFDRNSFHPVKEYLQGLQWDGKERLETLFIDYLGVDDTAYTRAVTRKSFVAAVNRVYQPGCKFDYVTVLVGAQGAGKSTIISKMGKHWFSDSLEDMRGKDAYGQVHGNWIIELGELNATRKADIEKVKHFITKQVDEFRPPYGRHEITLPRQCVFFGTTNDKQFLTDITGNRRFWVLEVNEKQITKDIWKDLNDEVDQLWAEAKTRYMLGEDLFLAGKLEELAKVEQDKFRVEDPLEVLIRDFLGTKRPKDWDELDAITKSSWVRTDEEEEDLMKLDRTNAQQIWVEVQGNALAHMNRYDSRQINAILYELPGWDKKSSLRVPGYGRSVGFIRSCE